jgi:hypothetical protein
MHFLPEDQATVPKRCETGYPVRGVSSPLRPISREGLTVSILYSRITIGLASVSAVILAGCGSTTTVTVTGSSPANHGGQTSTPAQTPTNAVTHLDFSQGITGALSITSLDCHGDNADHASPAVTSGEGAPTGIYVVGSLGGHVYTVVVNSNGDTQASGVSVNVDDQAGAYSANDASGVTGFNVLSGATLDVMAAPSAGGGQPVRIVGSIACPAS